jgi:hypothetical protein
LVSKNLSKRIKDDGRSFAMLDARERVIYFTLRLFLAYHIPVFRERRKKHQEEYFPN